MPQAVLTTLRMPCRSSRGNSARRSRSFAAATKLNLLTDDADTVTALDEAAGKAGVKFDVFVKIDCGYHRCGVEPHTAEAVDIPRADLGREEPEFCGNSDARRAFVQRKNKGRDRRDRPAGTRPDGRARRAAAGLGIEVPTVSIGSTPTITHVDHLDGVDEIRPGNYIFFDAFQATLGSCGFEDAALTVLAAGGPSRCVEKEVDRRCRSDRSVKRPRRGRS